MAKKDKKKDSDSGADASSWMVTFSDLSTLLLTFFVLLLSMSSMNERALRSAFVNFQSSSGILYFRNAARVMMPRDIVMKDIAKTLESLHLMDIRNVDEISVKDLSDDPHQDLNLLVATGNLIMIKKRPGTDDFSLIFGSKLLFDSASAELLPGAYPLLKRIAGFLKEARYRAYIDGHTDNVPIRSEEFESNDELSLARALSVLTYMVKTEDVPPAKVSMGAYGSSYPMANNDAEAGRAMNRRVEMIFRKIKP